MHCVTEKIMKRSVPVGEEVDSGDRAGVEQMKSYFISPYIPLQYVLVISLLIFFLLYCSRTSLGLM